MYWYLFNALVVLFFMWLITKKYGTLLNPIGFFGAYYLMAATISPLLYESLGLFQRISDRALHYTSLMDTIYFVALGSAFAVRSSPFKALFNRIFLFIRPFELKEESSGFAEFGLLVQAVVLFVLLMIGSGAGTLWITYPRLAYAMHRASAGVWWSGCQVTLFLTFLCVIFRKARSLKAVLGYAVCFASLAWFLASKADMMTYFILALFYTHVCIRKIANRSIVLIGLVVFMTVMALQLYQGTAQNLIGTLTYFDYFNTSAKLIDRFRDFGFRYGAVMFSNIWFYVPRGLYHAKPYVYGGVIPDEFLYPGAAADGWTAGMMQWTVGYCDFGVIGVILVGLFTGFATKGAYELFLERKDVQSMMLFGQIGFIYCIELFGNAPFFIFLIWLMFEIAFIRILSRIKVFSCGRRVRAIESS